MRLWPSHRDREPAVEALSDGPTASGARATVANDIFSDTKVRNARSWLPSRRQESSLPRPGCHHADNFFLSGRQGSE